MDRTRNDGNVDEAEPPSSKEDGFLAVPPTASRVRKPFGINVPTTLASGGAAWTAAVDTPSGNRMSRAAGEDPIPVLFPPDRW